MMSSPAPEQQAILADRDSRIRLVRAVPGSGKTWLIAEEMRRTLEKWKTRHRGIAALSFTNVARDEIRQALGFMPEHPHFVGTLDAFLLRYIVRPFCHLAGFDIKSIKLIPASSADQIEEKQRWSDRPLAIQLGKERHHRAHIFTSHFVGEESGRPIFSARLSQFDTSTTLIRGDDAQRIFDLKKRVWRKSGYASHSDITYIAQQILRGDQKTAVLRLLEKRFPILIVDELQDTGWFLGQVLQEILCNTNCKAILVGDPDQAIFEFSGATPALFDGFSSLKGTQPHGMTFSRRCPRRIREVAASLCNRDRELNGNDTEGTALLVVYDGTGHTQLSEFCSTALTCGIKLSVLVRRNNDRNKLLGILKRKVTFRSRPLEKLYAATNQLRAGNATRALDIGGSVLSKIIFNTDVTEEEVLQQHGISPFEWRGLIARILIECYREVGGENLHQWAERQRHFLRSEVGKAGWQQISQTPGPFPRKPASELSSYPAVEKQTTLASPQIECSTVHAAKGRTLDTVIYFVPEIKKDDKCPSAEWWAEDSEERRVAFVAITRASKAFVLCIERKSYNRLKRLRPEFVAKFDVRDLQFEECSELLSRNV